jgi:hypothetical protein
MGRSSKFARQSLRISSRLRGFRVTTQGFQSRIQELVRETETLQIEVLYGVVVLINHLMIYLFSSTL